MQTEVQSNENSDLPVTPKPRRGFAAFDKERIRQIASSGGKSAQATGLANKFTSEKTREAGKKGGAVTSANREHMAEIGRQGGLAKRGHRLRTAAP